MSESIFKKDKITHYHLEQDLSETLLSPGIVDIEGQTKDSMRRRLLEVWWSHQGDYSGAYKIEFTITEKFINSQDESDPHTDTKRIKMTLTVEPLD